MMLLGRNVKYSQADLLHCGQELFLRHRSGDGQTLQGGSNGDGRWFHLNKHVAYF